MSDWLDTGVYLPPVNLAPDVGPPDEPRDQDEPGTSAARAQCNWCGRRAECPGLTCRGTKAEQDEWAALATIVHPHPGSWMAEQGRTGRTWAAGLYRDSDGRIVHPEQVAS